MAVTTKKSKAPALPAGLAAVLELGDPVISWNWALPGLPPPLQASAQKVDVTYSNKKGWHIVVDFLMLANTPRADEAAGYINLAVKQNKGLLVESYTESPQDRKDVVPLRTDLYSVVLKDIRLVHQGSSNKIMVMRATFNARSTDPMAGF
ncbi:MAG: hypothetical protein ACN6OP_15830 [Pseudomonadales bacterium]